MTAEPLRRPPRRPPARRPATLLLKLDDVHTYYGQIHALQGVTIEVNRGEIVTLIGANGAGKTTTLKTICGLLHPRQGTVTFDGTGRLEDGRPRARPGRDRARPGGPPDLLPADGPREPPDGRLHPASQRRSTRTSSG